MASQAGAVQQAVEQRKAQISPEEYADQEGRARAASQGIIRMGSGKWV